MGVMSVTEKFHDAFSLAKLVQDDLFEKGFTGVIWNPTEARRYEEVEIWATEHCKNSVKICSIRCYKEDADGDLIQIQAYKETHFQTTLKSKSTDKKAFVQYQRQAYS